MFKKVGRKFYFEDAKVGYLNFRGEESTFNKEGDRNFILFLDEEDALALDAEGFNVTFPKENSDIANDEHTESWKPLAKLKVLIKFDKYPLPELFLVENENVTQLTEETAGQIDSSEKETIDLVINKGYWKYGGKSGVSAYISKIYVVVKTDVFDDKYGRYS